jgi:UDP-glucose 4-epimerase
MAAGESIKIQLFGVDYPTADGTCIRDYIHVNDLCAAHLNALEFLHHNTGFHAFNLGNGEGYSVRQVIAAAQDVVGRKMSIPECQRRPGDPARLVASSKTARRVLKWSPAQPDIHNIVESAWKWHLAPRY